MSSLVSACKKLSLLACVGAVPVAALGEIAFNTQGTEYTVAGSIPGDQVFPHLALNSFGGYLVWQDNVTDGDGYGISAQRINRSLAGSYGAFRVNQNGAGDQTLPQVALLSGGGTVFVWQSAVGAITKVYARFLKSDGTFATGDVAVSGYATDQQITPVVTSLPDGNALIVWASSGQDGSMLGVFGRLFSPGAPVGAEFQINETTLYNQRSPVLGLLPNGNVIVAWVSESQGGVAQNLDPTGRYNPSAGVPLFNVDLYGRLYNPTGTPVTAEFKINSGATLCANPCVSPSPDGFLVAWTGKPSQIHVTNELSNGWDIFGRAFDVNGQPKQTDFKINTYAYGDQYVPKAAYVGGVQMVLWTSLGQDGDREGVIARLVSTGGDPGTREFRVNTTVIGSQIYPVVAGNGGQDFLAVWSSYTGGNGFDLFGQHFAITQNINAPAAPYVSAESQSRLSVSWPNQPGYANLQFSVYMDGSSTPALVTGNEWTATNLQPSSTHNFQIAYTLPNGQLSGLSAPAKGVTWGEDANFDGLPDDWQAKYWGPDPSQWPPPNVDSDGDGATNLQEFLAGTNPLDPASVLRTRMTSTPQGTLLGWNTEPGLVYQVQTTSDGVTWTNLGSPRFSAGNTDSIPITGSTNAALYRINRVR